MNRGHEAAAEAALSSFENGAALLEALAEGLLCTDASGAILACNRSFREMLRWPAGEAPPAHAAAYANHLAQLLPGDGRAAARLFPWRHGMPSACEADLRFPDGRYIHARLTTASLSGQKCWLLVCRDITEQKRVEEALRASNAYLRAMLDLAGDAIITTDLGGVVQTFNRAAERIFGIREAEMAGSHIRWLMPVETQGDPGKRLLEFLQRNHQHGYPVPKEERARRANGEEFDAEMCITVVGTGEDRALVGVVRDITDRKAAATALEDAHRREIETAARIQEALLVGDLPANCEGVEFAALSPASQRVDGDFFEVIQFPDTFDAVDLVVGDVMGKGVSAALLGAATKAQLHRVLTSELARQGRAGLPLPADIVRGLHDALVPELMRLESYVTLVYARLSRRQRRLEFIDCGHTRAIHYSVATGRSEFLTGENVPLGVLSNEEYFPRRVFFLPGDLFVFYTDGLTEARDAAGEGFGEARLASLVERCGREPAGEVLERIRSAALQHCGGVDFEDDVNCIVVRVTQLAGEDVNTDVLALESSHEALSRARQWLRALLETRFRGAFQEREAHEMELALHEAIVNCIVHGYGNAAGRPITLLAETIEQTLRVRIVDEAPRFVPDRVPVPDFTGAREGGFGMYLLQQCFDSVEYGVDGRGRNCLALGRVFSGRRMHD